MSDDFGTVNVRRGDRAREIEVLRQHYRTHRESLARLVGDAPTEYLANEYQRLIVAIDDSMRKLDELEGRGAAAAAAPAAAAVPPRPTSPGMRPLTMTSPAPPPVQPAAQPQFSEPAAPNATLRTLIIIIGGIVVLGAIGYLIWRASSDRRRANQPGQVVEQPVTPATADTAPPPAVTESPAAAPATSPLKVTPAMADYGVIRKGTRAVRQFEATNSGSNPIDFQVARSACRCLFYDYRGHLPPKGKETVTVTVDGAKAKAGQLSETLAVTSKKDPSVNATIGIKAVIQ
jgi:hypothetical protein